MKPAWRFTIILIITFGVLSIYSFIDYKIVIGGIELQKTDVKKFFMGDTILPEANTLVEFFPKKTHPVMDSTSQKILLIGDSMLEQLRWSFADYVKYNGHEMKSVIWYSSQSEWYGKSDTLKYFIKEYKPTYVILVLGANELFVSNIIEKRNKYAKRILEQIDTLPYLWVGPPNWKDDTGINDMILKNVGKQRYYPSKNLKYKRYADGAHPKPESAAMWMDSLAIWIMRDSKYPILLNKPPQKLGNSPNTTILQPWK